MIYTSENPGPWQKWITKPENAKLNIQEARAKYLKEQLICFEKHIQASIKYNLPLIIHQRNTEHEIVDFLKAP